MDTVRESVCVQNDRDDNLIESFCELEKMMDDFYKGSQNREFDVMACERELYYTVLLHELHFNKALRATQKDGQDFIDKMASVFSLDTERRHQTGHYLNDYLNVKGKMKND